MKGLWKKFERLTSKCYTYLAGDVTNEDAWDKAYEVLVEIVREGRSQNSNYAKDCTCWMTGRIMSTMYAAGCRTIWIIWIRENSTRRFAESAGSL